MAKTTNSLTLNDFVKYPLGFYSFVGIKLFKWNEADVMTTREKVMLILTSVNALLHFTAKVSYFVLDEFDSIVHMTQWFLYLIFASNAFCKMFTVVLGRKELHNALKELQSMFPKSSQERREFRLMEGYKDLMRHCTIIIFIHWSIAVMFLVFPLVQSTLAYWNSGDENPNFIGHTPYVVTYPFDSSRGIGYVYVYSAQVLGGITVSCYFIGSDMLLMCTIYMVFMQYENLCRRIRSFKSLGFEEDMREMKKLLETHGVLNELAQIINNVFSLSTLLNYMISTLVVVLIGIQITTGSEMLDFVKFVGFFLSATCQAFYVCLFGSKLLQHSSDVSESFFGQEWYETDVRCQRMVVMAIARSQTPSHLTAYKFFMISMESFANLMTTAYQFFTLLKTRMEEQN